MNPLNVRGPIATEEHILHGEVGSVLGVNMNLAFPTMKGVYGLSGCNRK